MPGRSPKGGQDARPQGAAMRAGTPQGEREQTSRGRAPFVLSGPLAGWFVTASPYRFRIVLIQLRLIRALGGSKRVDFAKFSFVKMGGVLRHPPMGDK